MLSLLGKHKMKILLTGGTGFVGRSILRYILFDLNTLDISIVVLSRDPDSFLSSYPEFIGNSRLSFVKANIQNRNSLPWNDNFTHVLHAAADVATLSSQSPLKCYDQIVDGTRNILDLAIATKAKRFLLTSSGAIYGSQPQNISTLSEDWAGSPSLADTKCAYGNAKRSAECLSILMAQEYGIETVVARCFAFIGSDLPLRVHFAIGNFIYDAFRSDVIKVSGDGSALRTYLYQNELALWLMTLLIHGQSGRAYNVGSDEVISIAQLACLVRDILCPSKEVVILGSRSPGSVCNRYIPDITKIKNEFSLSVTTSLSHAIRLTGAALSSHLTNSNIH